MAMPKQETGQLLACLTQATHRRLPSTHEITHRLVRLIRNPYRGQLSSSMQRSKFACITPVGLDPLARLAWDQRWSDHHALVSKAGELSLDAVAARTGLVAEPELAVPAGQLRRQRLQRG
jgi:hypothetical protein